MKDDDGEREGMGGWKRPLLIVLATAPILVAVGAFVFMARTELAFDDASCPYAEGETQHVRAGVSVREDARECLEGVEEHRWVLLREGEPPREIGRRRLESRYFEGSYAWTVTEEEGGRVRLEIRSPGQEPRVFRERAPDAGNAASP